MHTNPRRGLIRPTSLETIITLLGEDVVKVIGSTDRSIERLVGLSAASGGALSFSRRETISNDRATAILAPIDCTEIAGPTLICVKNPRLAFIRLLSHFFQIISNPGIHPTA